MHFFATHEDKKRKQDCRGGGLVVSAGSLACGIENTDPVVLLEIGPSVNVEEGFDIASIFPDGEDGQGLRALKLAQKRADKRGEGAPIAGKLAGAEVPRALVLGACEDAIADGAVC